MASGLILIQIDGLSHTQFGRALDSGKMPCLNQLLTCEGYGFIIFAANPVYGHNPSSSDAMKSEGLVLTSGNIDTDQASAAEGGEKLGTIALGWRP